MKLKRILCPVDFSDTSQHAIDYALALARWYGADITALHACDPTGPDDEVERLRAEVAAEFRRRRVRCTSTFEASQQPHAPDSRCAASLPADVIVMGPHGLSGFEHLVLGSVPKAAVGRAVGLHGRARTRPQCAIRQLLCAVDFSPPSVGADGLSPMKPGPG